MDPLAVSCVRSTAQKSLSLLSSTPMPFGKEEKCGWVSGPTMRAVDACMCDTHSWLSRAICTNQEMLNIARSPRRRPRLCKQDRTCRAKSQRAIQEPLHGRHQRRSTSARARVHTPAVVGHTPPRRHTATSRRHLGGCTRIVNSPKHLSVSAECAPTARARMHALDKRHQLTSETHRLSCSTRARLKLPVRLHPNSIPQKIYSAEV